jgi:Tol biopolymer transport system component
MKKLTVLILVSILFFSCTEINKKVEKNNFPELTDKYLNQERPGLESKLFAPDIISTGKYELNAAFSPDYKEFYYSIRVLTGQIVIMYMKYIDNQWTEPEVVSFSGKYSDADPFITHDNKWMYFVSMRPVDESSEPIDYDIWRTKRLENGWGEPEHLDSTVNSEFTDVYPTLTKNGTLYFSSGRSNASEGRDIFYSKMKGDSFEQAVKLEGTINDFREGDVFISPNEDYLIVSRKGKGGLVISFRNEESWSVPINMGEQINLTGYEYCPMISPDGKFLFFTSEKDNFKPFSHTKIGMDDINNHYDSLFLKPQNGLGDIYWISTEIINKLRKEK